MHVKTSMRRRSDADCAHATCPRTLSPSNVYCISFVSFEYVNILFHSYSIRPVSSSLRCICPMCPMMHFVPGRHLQDGDAVIRQLVVRGHPERPRSHQRATVSHESHSDFLIMPTPGLSVSTCATLRHSPTCLYVFDEEAIYQAFQRACSLVLGEHPALRMRPVDVTRGSRQHLQDSWFHHRPRSQ